MSENVTTRNGIDLSAVEIQDGTHVAEVIALYGPTVLDVQHVGQRERGRAAPWIAAGVVLIATGTALFAHEVTRDWDGYRAQTASATAQALPMPTAPGNGLGGLGLALALLGLVPLTLGGIRLRERPDTRYTLGEHHDVSFPARGTPDGGDVTLVEGEHAHTLGFTEDMTGSVTVDGSTVSLHELAASGRARKSGGAFAFALPPGARARLHRGDLSFHVNSVLPGARTARAMTPDRAFWTFNSAALVAIGGLIALAHFVPKQQLHLDLSDVVADARFVGYVTQPDETTPEEPVEPRDESDGDPGGQGKRHQGPEGKMGRPQSDRSSGLYVIKGPRDAIEQLGRNHDPDMMARTSGILGLMQMDQRHFVASPYGEAFTLGTDDEDVWGGLTGTEVGEAFGNMGLGLVGSARGGGGVANGIGLGDVGLIGYGAGGGDGRGIGRGDGDGYRGGRGTGFRKRKRSVPRVGIAKIDDIKGIDKDVVRRIVRAHINEVRHCYNQGLVRDPNLTGRVAVQFSIGPTGKVPVSVVASTTLDDANVGLCISTAVRRWRFPKPLGGGAVVVTYPFVLRPG